MIAPGGGCPKGLIDKMFDIGIEFKKNPAILRRFGSHEADQQVRNTFLDIFHLPIENVEGVKLTEGLLNTFRRRLAKVTKASEKGDLIHNFGSVFYTPSGVAERNPQLISLMDNLHNVGLQYKGRTDRHDRAFQNIITHMQKEMLVNGYSEGFVGEIQAKRKLKNATKAANKHEAIVEELVVDTWNGVPGAKEKLSTALRAETNFYVNGEGKVINQMRKTIEEDLPKIHFEKLKEWWTEKPKLLKLLEKNKITRSEYNTRRKNILNPVFAKYGAEHPESALKSAPMVNAVTEYIDLMDSMHSTLVNGVNAYVGSIKQGMKGRYTPERIAEIGEKIKEKISPDKQVGYFPHYKRILNIDFFDNLMPHMQRLSDAVASDFKIESNAVESALKGLEGYVTGRTKGRRVTDIDSEGINAQNEYSWNFFTNIKRYMDEVDRFNMVAHADMYTKESLNAAKEMFKNGEPLDGYARSTVEMMIDMNARMKGGYGFENENVEGAMKTLLALEFTSKLGYNLRSPFKNATQGLLNLVEFGPIIMMKSTSFYNNNQDIKVLVDNMMKEAGFLFADTAAPELVESLGGLGKSFTQKIRITDNETIEFKKPGLISSVHSKVSNFAGVSGKMMAKIENFNRRTTFRTAFFKMYEQLNNSTSYKTSLRESGLSESQIKAEILSRSRNYGIRKTTLLHFDYAELAKAPWMLHPAGRLLGQFQHYGIKFLEYNIDKAKEAGDDILAGELLGTRAKKAYGLGMVYFLAPAIASAATGLDISNIVEHNTKEQINKLWALFTGDEDEIKKAYYGKGILTGLPFIGAPVVSDALAIGNIWEFMDMDNETMEMLLTGYEDYGLKSKDKKIYETIRLLNVAAGRGFYKTLPMFFSGSPFAALQHEFGIFPTKESRELKEKVMDISSEVLPDELLQSLKLLELHRQRAVSRGPEVEPTQLGQQSSGSMLSARSMLGSKSRLAG